MRNIVKFYIIGLAAIFFVISQLLILNNGNIVGSVVFMMFFIILLIISLLNLHEKIIALIFGLVEKIKNYKPTPSPEEKHDKNSSVSVAQPVKHVHLNAAISIAGTMPGSMMQPRDEKFSFSFRIPKMFFFATAMVLFVLAQFLLFRQRFLPAVVIIVIDVYLFLKFIFMKQEFVEYNISIRTGLKLLLLAGGAALLVIGWLLLLNRNNNIQNLGVIITTAGIVMAYISIPNFRKDSEQMTNILLDNYTILNKPLVKIVLLTVAAVALKVGSIVIYSPELNMMSMIYYAVAIGCIFLSLPWINFKESYVDNKWINIFKLASILVALGIAYFAQRAFVENKPNTAVVMYIIAAAIFIIVLPIYNKKEEDTAFPVQMEWVYMMAIMAVSLFLRVYQLDQRPFGLENDETGGMVSIVKNFWVGQHPIYAYIQEFVYNIFGYNRIGMRMYGVILGMLTIPIIYFALRVAFGPRVAMVVTIIFSVTRWNLHYSRSGHGTIMMILAESMAFYFILKAIENRSKLNYFFAGIGSGLCWYGVLTGWFVVITPLAYFILESLKKNDNLKKNYLGIIVFILGFWLFASQHIKNFFISQNIYFSRIKEVSVFSQDPNAPRQNPAKGIVENARKVLLMFNHHGDSRQRNSGAQPYEPTIDFVSSMFFMIGLFYSIYYSRYYMCFIFVMIFASQMAGSVFSIEAPSAMRAIGTMVPAIFFIGLIISRIWIIVRRVFGRYGGWIFAAAMLIPLFFIAKDNYKQYFGRWVTGMDELATAAGQYAYNKLEKVDVVRDKNGKLTTVSECAKNPDKCWRIFLYTSLYYPGHPPFRIFRWDLKVDSSRDFLDTFLAISKVENENLAIYLHHDTFGSRPFWQEFFPGAYIDEYNHPCCGKLFEVIQVKNAEIQKIRGLLGIYRSASGTKIVTNDAAEFGDTMAVDMPYSVEWSGLVFIPYYSNVQFLNPDGVPVTIFVDKTRLDTLKAAKLAKGFHEIRISASRNKPSDKLNLSMLLKRYEGTLFQAVKKLTKNYLYSFPNTGLHIYQYAGTTWTDLPINMEEILPVVDFTDRIVSNGHAMLLSGKINIPQDGNYVITPNGNGNIRMIIDDKYYWDMNSPAPGMEKVTPAGAVRQNVMYLKRGKHEIRFYTLNTSRFYVTWNRGINGTHEVVPFSMFEPDLNITGGVVEMQ